MRLDQTGPNAPQTGNWIRRLRIEHWTWLHAKLALIAWMLTLLGYTPTAVYDALGWVIILVATVTVTGGLLSITGIIMSAQTGRTALLGLSVELTGLWLMFAGPISYLGVQVYLAFQPEGNQRYALVWLAYLTCAFLICRLARVIALRHREAHDPMKAD